MITTIDLNGGSLGVPDYADLNMRVSDIYRQMVNISRVDSKPTKVCLMLPPDFHIYQVDGVVEFERYVPNCGWPPFDGVKTGENMIYLIYTPKEVKKSRS